MDKSAVIQSLRDEQERIRQNAERRMAALGDAIAVLEEADELIPEIPQADAPHSPRETSVVNLIRLAALSFGESVILDKKMLRERAIQQAPDKADTIKKGIYNALARLIEREEFKRVPGGYQRTPKMSGASPAADVPQDVAKAA